MPDTRYCYSACCTWHGSINETKAKPLEGSAMRGVIPGCPHCGSPLFELEDRAEWDKQIAAFKLAHPELPLYTKWMETLHAPCVPLKTWNWKIAYAEFVETNHV